MKQKVLVRGPALSQSGYGEHARFVLRALRTREDVFDIFLENINWGKTSWLWEDTEERRWIDSLLNKTIHFSQNGGKFDISLQVTIPNEWKRLAPINIGCTAGIETTKIAPQWVEKSYLMDKIIVVSEHAKYGFVETAYNATNSQTGQPQSVSAKGPIEVVNYPHRPVEASEINLDLRHDFNFLAISQWSPRKNLENTIKWFVEEFIDQEVGLVVKTSVANNSNNDFQFTKNRIKKLLNDPRYSNRKCSVHIVHGYMKDAEMSALYQHPKIKALVNIAHGEGYGLPIFEAAGYGLPVVTIPWGGQVDFLYVPERRGKKKKMKRKFAEVEYTLGLIQKEAHWEGVLQKDSLWAYADQGSYKMTLREVYKKYGVYKKRAEALKVHIENKFSEEKIYEEFVSEVLGKKKIKPRPVNGISFCISTNGAKPEKTILEINSIHNTMSDIGVPYEVVVAGNTTPFKGLNITTVHTPEDAEKGLLAKLRNNAGEVAKHDVLVFVDDDFLFPKNWATRFLEFSRNNDWDVLANKILLPDGSRFWDRSTKSPHQLVDYDYPSYSSNLYQTGGFWIMRAEVYRENKWNSTLVINAAEKGQSPENEDIELSRRIYSSGYQIDFDKENLVWHNDSSYVEFEQRTLKKDIVAKYGINFFPPNCSDFKDDLSNVNNNER